MWIVLTFLDKLKKKNKRNADFNYEHFSVSDPHRFCGSRSSFLFPCVDPDPAIHFPGWIQIQLFISLGGSRSSFFFPCVDADPAFHFPGWIQIQLFISLCGSRTTLQNMFVLCFYCHYFTLILVLIINKFEELINNILKDLVTPSL